ncbi:MAG: carboxypeptidase regulatory-like domain-containing protein [Nitrospirae bacterium]|nr:carboxypeptidase regulatory-like domain-containing protein [Nitrospirota bacterium]
MNTRRYGSVAGFGGILVLSMWLVGCAGKKSESKPEAGGAGAVQQQTKAQAVQEAVTGVAFDPAAAAGDTGAVRGAVTSSGVRGIDLGGAEQGVRGGVRGGVRATPRRQAEGEQPVAGARVRIEGTSLETISNEKGEFVIPFVPPGNYMVVGDKQGESGEVYAFSQNAAVTPGGSIDLGSLSLAETGAIRGKVKRADATSQLGIDVFIPGMSFVAKTDDDGNFNILYIPKGTYKLAAMFPGFEPNRWKDIVVESKKTTELPAVELKRAAQDKAKAAGIFGRVTASGGGGVRDAVVTTVPDTQNVRSDSAGNFIISNIAPGVYLVKAVRPGFTENSTFVDLTESLFDQVEIRLAPGAQILAGATTDVKAGAPPSISIDGPNAVTPGSTVTFKAGVSDSDGDNLYLKWKAGGGTFDNTWRDEVNWTAPASKGVFIIEVTVTDGVLSDKATTAVSVAPEGQTVTLDTTPPFPPRPDKLAVKMSPPGTEDTIEGQAGCVEPNATVKFYSDGLLSTLLVSAKASADGSFPAVKIGDNKGDQNDQIFIGVFDPAGNLSPVYFVVNDKTPPDTVITATPCGAQNSCLSAKNTADFEFNTAEIGSSFECKLDQAAFAGCTSPHTFTGLGNGAHTASIRAKDAAGNLDPFPASFNWGVDAEVPSAGAVTVTGQATATHVGPSFNLNGSFTESISSLTGCDYCLSTDGACDSEWAFATLSGSKPTYTCKVTGLTCTNGQTVTVNLRAFDSAGNTSTATSLARTCDTAAPSTATNAPAAWVNADTTVALSPADTGAGMTGGVAKTTYCLDAFDLCTPSVAGTSAAVTCAAATICQTYVRFAAQDAAGNAETTKSVLVRIDKQAPSSTLTAPADGALYAGGGTVSLSGTAADGSGSGVTLVQYSSNGGTNWSNATGTTAWSGSFTLSSLTASVKFRATDAAGNVETAGSGVSAWYSQLAASNMLGQLGSNGTPNYTIKDTNNPDGTGLNSPKDVAVDPAGGRLFVADGNNRVLVFNLATGALVDHKADFVLCQADMITTAAQTVSASSCSPQGLAYDAGGNRLFVSDSQAHRVLVFDVASITNGEAAVGVIGQTDFTSNSSGLTSSKLNNPNKLAFGGNRLYVADNSNHRVMIFDVTAISSPEIAINVLGQANFTTGTDSGCDQNGMNWPFALAYDATNDKLYVGTGAYHNRMLVFDGTPGLDGENALNVLGQPGFTTCTVGTTQAKLNIDGFTFGAAFGVYNTYNTLFVADGKNNRLVAFDVRTAASPAQTICGTTSTSGIVDGMNASCVVGQTLFTTNTAATTQGGMNGPRGVAVDTTNNKLWVADMTNHRVLMFDIAAISDGENAADVLGHVTTAETVSYLSGEANNPRETSFNFPQHVALDTVNHRLYVSDLNNSRVLVFNLDTSNNLADRVADFVLGQPSLLTVTQATTQAGMKRPQGLAVDTAGNRLFVADHDNARVLVYDVASITNGEIAANVLGQTIFTSNTPNNTSSTMSGPTGLAYDSARKWLYVADDMDPTMMAKFNHRVTVYDVNAITDGESAINVLGQANFTDQYGSCARARLSGPQGLALNANGSLLFVADNSNDRVIVYDVTSITDGENAEYVLGQASFGTCTNGLLSATGLDTPLGVALDTAASRLYVTDQQNSRIVMFDVATIVNGEAAKTPIAGQADLVTGTEATSQTAFNLPRGLAFDSGNIRLYAVDEYNHRLMIFNIP